LSREPDVSLRTGGRPIATTWLDKPSLRRRRSVTLPAMPLAWRSLRPTDYDAVISSHHAFAHANRLARKGVHLSYVYSPARYVWSPEIDKRGHGSHLALARALLKRVDGHASRRVDGYAAISQEVARRITQYWDRDAEVIHPPVRVDYFGTSNLDTEPDGDYVLGVGRWIPYKNLHLVIDAASAAGLPVKIAGRGPDRSRIEASARAARVPVELIESPSDDQLRKLYRNAAVLVFPTFEDFGIVPVEAQAAGTPVVALARGGALDTVVDGKSGVLTESVDIAELAAAIEVAVSLNSDDCVSSARRFGFDVFQTKILDWAARWGITP